MSVLYHGQRARTPVYKIESGICVFLTWKLKTIPLTHPKVMRKPPANISRICSAVSSSSSWRTIPAATKPKLRATMYIMDSITVWVVLLRQLNMQRHAWLVHCIYFYWIAMITENILQCLSHTVVNFLIALHGASNNYVVSFYVWYAQTGRIQYFQ